MYFRDCGLTDTNGLHSKASCCGFGQTGVGSGAYTNIVTPAVEEDHCLRYHEFWSAYAGIVVHNYNPPRIP